MLLLMLTSEHFIQVLLGITPQGYVLYVFETWGGRIQVTSYLTEHCGILDNLLPEDVVLADWGFNIADSVGLMHARLHIPAKVNYQQPK